MCQASKFAIASKKRFLKIRLHPISSALKNVSITSAHSETPRASWICGSSVRGSYCQWWKCSVRSKTISIQSHCKVSSKKHWMFSSESLTFALNQSSSTTIRSNLCSWCNYRSYCESEPRNLVRGPHFSVTPFLVSRHLSSFFAFSREMAGSKMPQELNHTGKAQRDLHSDHKISCKYTATDDQREKATTCGPNKYHWWFQEARTFRNHHPWQMWKRLVKLS